MKKMGVLLFILLLSMIGIYKINLPKNVQNLKVQHWLMQEKETSLTVILAGDALYHTEVYQDGKKENTYDFKKQLEYIKPIVSHFDLAYYNQESLLGGKELGLSSYPRFNSPQEVGDAFLDAGFNMVSLANNHTLDKNEEGVLSSLEYWNTKPCFVAGSYKSQKDRDIVIGEKNQIRYAFFSYTTSTNGLTLPKNKEYLVDIYEEEKVKQDIEKIKPLVDIIFVAMHWGTEYNPKYTKEQENIAQYLSNLGVDIIIGNHPHVIEPVVKINNTFVFYSLGNFISGQNGDNKRIGLLPSFVIHKRVSHGQIEVFVDTLQAELVYTDHDNNFKNFKIIPFSKLNKEEKESWSKTYEEIANPEGLLTFTPYTFS